MDRKEKEAKKRIILEKIDLGNGRYISSFPPTQSELKKNNPDIN